MGKDKYIVIDTETTGFYNTDDIIQIGTIELDSNMNIVKIGEDYFNTDRPISSKVSNITGLNNKMLEVKSKGMFFEDKIDKYLKYLTSGEYIIIGHNTKFDVRMLDSNLERAGLGKTNFKNSICTMNKYKHRVGLKMSNGKLKNPKLGELFNYALRAGNVSKGQIDNLFNKMTGQNGKAHEALYDAYMTYISLRILK